VALLTLAILSDMTQTKVAKTSKATVSVMGSLAIDNQWVPHQLSMVLQTYFANVREPEQKTIL